MPKPTTVVRTFQAGSTLAQHAPPGLIDPLRSAVARRVARLSPERTLMLRRHLRRVLGPDADDAKIDSLAEAAFDSYARYWIDSARLQGASPAEVDAGFTVEGFEHIEDAFARGVGPILALPHLGGWEWAGRWLTCRPGYEVTVVVEAVDPPELFTWMADYRKSFGMNVVPLGPKAAGAIIAALKANHVVCLLSDRDLGGGGVGVDFFGEQTTLPAGPATVAFRTGAAIIPVGVYQQPGRHHAICRPPLDTERQGKLRADVARVTQALAVELEWLISKAPEQWHLLQPNWPSDHDFLAANTNADSADGGAPL